MATTDTVDKAESAARAVEDRIDSARESVGDRMGRVKEKMSDVAEGVRTRAAQLREKIRETEFSDVTSQVNDYVRNNPGKSIAVALGIGFALGLLLRRRSDD